MRRHSKEEDPSDRLSIRAAVAKRVAQGFAVRDALINAHRRSGLKAPLRTAPPLVLRGCSPKQALQRSGPALNVHEESHAGAMVVSQVQGRGNYGPGVLSPP